MFTHCISKAGDLRDYLPSAPDGGAHPPSRPQKKPRADAHLHTQGPLREDTTHPPSKSEDTPRETPKPEATPPEWHCTAPQDIAEPLPAYREFAENQSFKQSHIRQRQRGCNTQGDGAPTHRGTANVAQGKVPSESCPPALKASPVARHTGATRMAGLSVQHRAPQKGRTP
jgi:hypothetical protein